MESEIKRRRTFAIISHPDAGKTTLTEKFLLYGGAVQLAGSVTARRRDRAATSDWMELEKQRGISVTSTVLQFDYNGYRVNLLDTPGHEDFSEDTYRVLTAVDAAIMVVDAAKGIEAQTRKLFDVCRMRGVPIFTFVNKCDRPGREPLALLDEIESVLGLAACPINWPMGLGVDFIGVYDRLKQEAHLYEKADGGRYRAPESVGGLEDPVIVKRIGEDKAAALAEEAAMLDEAGARFDAQAVLEGRLTPVYFGSALNNFGVQLLLDGFLESAPSPKARQSTSGLVRPGDAPFSGFVFKIQANMDPNHRDRIAFVRVCSGRFERDMSVWHGPSAKKIRLSFSHRLFGRDRETQDEAWPGDVIGIAGHSELGIGDTLTEDPAIVFDEIPRFPPECFVTIHNTDTQNHKRYRAGLDQLLQEKVVQRFRDPDSPHAIPLLGAVGPLQFDVVKYRLESEYRAPVRMEAVPWRITRWVDPATPPEAFADVFFNGVLLVLDDFDRRVLLFQDEWNIQYFESKNKGIGLLEYPPDNAPKAAVMAD